MNHNTANEIYSHVQGEHSEALKLNNELKYNFIERIFRKVTGLCTVY